MEYNGGYMNAGYGAFTFEDPLSVSEDENEDIHHAVEYSILESNRAEMFCYDAESSCTEEDQQYTESIQGSSMEHSDELMRQRKASMTKRKKWWRRLFSSLNIFKNFKQNDVTSWESSTSTSERDSSCHTDKVCDVCDEAVGFQNQILCDGSTHTYWGQTACYKHLSDGTTRCCSCRRFKIGNMRYIRLNDGRKLCSDCHCTAILDTKTFISLSREVYRFLEGINMKIIKDIPILLVDAQEIDRIYHQLGGKPNGTLGMTTYVAGFVVRSIARTYQRGENIHVVEEVQHIRRIHEVTSMLIVYGFSRLAIGATLAHEMMHAWMRTAGYRGIRLEVEEGICEVMAHRWLDWYAFVGYEFLHATPDQAQFLRNLKEILKNNIETNYNKIYGGGFRDAKWAIERYGLKYTMSHVAHTGNFPQ